MDHARKIGKSEVSTVWTKKRPSPPCSITDRPLIRDEEVSEDRRLANWRRWLNDRKKHTKEYSRCTDRDCRDLLINTPDEYRRKVEMKELAKIAVGSANRKTTNEHRIDPGFWVTPEFLPKHGNPNLPDIAITLTKRQLNATPELERIALPELTRQERGLSAGKNQTPLWKHGETSKTLGAMVSREIKSFEAKESEIKKLAIRGTTLGRRKPETPNIPITMITGPEADETKNQQNSLEDVDVIALKIQDREIKLVDQGESKKRGNAKSFNDEITWSLIFKSSGPNAIERSIRLENLGTFAVTYRWRRRNVESSLIPQTQRTSPFFFNKNEDVLLPGQVTVQRVWFRSPNPCLATEFWTLVTEPKLCRTSLVFRFWGSCESSTKTLDVSTNGRPTDDSIDRYLDRRVRDTMIQEIIQEILENARETRLSSPAYGSLFGESEIFQAKNPGYFYRPNVLQRLRDVYDEATSDDSPAWSLSLGELREIIVRLRPPDAMNRAFLRFSELCRECVKPCVYRPLGGTKRSTVCRLLCSFVNKFEAEEEKARHECSRGSDGVKGQSEGRGDTTRSNSASGVSQDGLTPRRKTRSVGRTSSRPRTASSRTSLIIANREASSRTPEKQSDAMIEFLSYNEVFYIRIRALLVDTVDRICGVVDTLNNLNSGKK